MKFKKTYGGREKYATIKYKKDLVGDCVMRAIAIALNQDYKQTFIELSKLSVEMLTPPNQRKCYEAYLKSKGWIKHKPLRDTNNKKLRVYDFHKYSGDGIFLVHTTKHLTCIINDTLWDSWNCQNWCANSFYTPDWWA